MSEEALFSSHWHRVRDVRPRLAGDVVATRHLNRGRVSWVLKRRSGRDLQRVDATSFGLIDQLDGHRTVGEIWERALLDHDQGAPTQDQWVGLLADLHAGELLMLERSVTAQPVFERREQRRRRDRRERHLNPLYLRFRLGDPDRLLCRLAPLGETLFSRRAWLVWCCLSCVGLAALLVGWGALIERWGDRTFPSARVALLMILIYPLLKLLHELAHGLAVKRYGGSVHECGIALMVLVPVPYVDASSSAAFPDRGERLLVGAAGILVELACAAIGAVLWVGTAGLVQEIGLVLMLLGGLSTLLINGNPLLRFDGYYLLSDALQIPNLATRGRRAALAQLQRCLGDDSHPVFTVEDARERAWLLAHGVLSAVYRTGLMLWIAWWLSDRFPLPGIALAGFALITAVVQPLWRGLRSVTREPALQNGRSVSLLAGLPIVILGMLVLVPVPFASATQGVVWLPDEAVLRAPETCQVSSTPVRAGDFVAAGTPLFECTDPELAIRERDLMAGVDELSVLAAGMMVSRPREYARLQAQRRAQEAALADVRARLSASHHVAALDGRFDVPGDSVLAGRVLRRGDIAAYVVPERQRTIRVALSEHDAGRLDAGIEAVELRLAHAPKGASVHSSRIVSRTPRPGRQLVSAALGEAGGGVHPNDPSGDDRQVIDPVFDLELAWPRDMAPVPVGTHVGVRFEHAPAPLAARLVEQVRLALASRASW